MITAKRLREALDYDPATGVFTWKIARGYTAKAGTVAGCLNALGYVQISFEGGRYSGHRLAWLYVTGRWPSKELDHINRNRADNRLANLREASGKQNHANMGCHRDSKSGVRGVIFNRGRWQANMRIDGRYKYLGSFLTKEEARDAYNAKARQVHGEFVPHQTEQP
jgi:hypothetical protein